MGESRFRAVAKTVNHGWYVEYDDTGETVCDLYFKDGSDIVEFDNAETNAHLIASAPDMVSRISELKAENARLREALTPFSGVAGEMFARNYSASDVVWAVPDGQCGPCLTFEEFMAARAALGDSEGQS
jgi:hypothetical protein